MNLINQLTHEADGQAIAHVVSTTSRRSRSQRELLRNTQRLSVSLQAHGVRDGDRVLILTTSPVETLESILAAFHMGATAVPVSPLTGQRNLESIVSEMRPACCIFEEPLPPAIDAALPGGCQRVSLNRVSEPARGRWLSYATLVETENATSGPFPSRPDHPALVVYSSGSEGQPKAIAFSHAQLLTFLEHYAELYAQFFAPAADEARHTPVALAVPLTHMGGLIIGLRALMAGDPLYSMTYFVPDTFLSLIGETRCPLIMLVPSMYRALLKSAQLQTTDRSAVKFCMTFGEACPVELVRQIEEAFRAPVVSAYGLTECLTGLGHVRESLLRQGAKQGSCGQHFFGEVKLVDEHLREHPSLGELWVRNSTVHECYLDAQLNRSRFKDGWFRTRDLFFRDAGGNFFHRGRCDDMFICNGKNLYPAEIESVLMGHPSVEFVFAAPVLSASRQSLPAVLVVPKRPVSESELREFAIAHGPAHAVPQVVRIVQTLPQTGPGKINRLEAKRLLQEAYQDARS